MGRMDQSLAGVSPSTAQGIYQGHIDQTSTCLMDGDMEAVLDRIHLPMLLVTEDTTRRLYSEAELIRAVEDYAMHLESLGTSNYIRLCTDAEFLTPSRIVGHHSTFILSDGRLVADPYLTRMILVCTNGTWRCHEQHAEARNHDCRIVSAALLRQPKPHEPFTGRYN